MTVFRTFPGYLQTSRREILRAGENETLEIEIVRFTNEDSSNRSIDLEHAPKDTASSGRFGLCHDLVVNSKTSQVVEGPIYMMPGDTLSAFASSANAISVHIYGKRL